jgi:hypothetical protein
MADTLAAKAPQLLAYWLGKGLKRWAVPKDGAWTRLHAALKSEGVPARFLNGLTTNIYQKHFGHGPNEGKNNKGNPKRKGG